MRAFVSDLGERERDHHSMMNPPSTLRRCTMITELNEVVPSELLADQIFSRLPLKCVGQSRCVCKSWYYLLKDPSFLKLHVKKNPQPLKHLQAFARAHTSYLRFRSVHITDKEECSNREFDFPIKAHFQSFIGSDNGLVCIAINLKRNSSKGSRLALWNPTTKDYNILPQPPRLRIGRLEPLLAFAYDSSLDDYKILRVVASGSVVNGLKSFHQTNVYSLRSNSWKRLPNAPESYGYPNRGCALNGCIYFLRHSCPDRSDVGKVVAFNLKDDSFAELPLPTNSPHSGMTLVALGGQLSAYHYSLVDLTGVMCGEVKLWTLKEEEEDNKVKGKHCWIELMTISSLCYENGLTLPCKMVPVCFLHNGKLLMVINIRNGAFILRKFHLETRFVLFDPERGIIEDLPIDLEDYWRDCGRITYTESLVAPNSPVQGLATLVKNILSVSN